MHSKLHSNFFCVLSCCIWILFSWVVFGLFFTAVQLDKDNHLGEYFSKCACPELFFLGKTMLRAVHTVGHKTFCSLLVSNLYVHFEIHF